MLNIAREKMKNGHHARFNISLEEIAKKTYHAGAAKEEISALKFTKKVHADFLLLNIYYQ